MGKMREENERNARGGPHDDKETGGHWPHVTRDEMRHVTCEIPLINGAPFVVVEHFFGYELTRRLIHETFSNFPAGSTRALSNQSDRCVISSRPGRFSREKRARAGREMKRERTGGYVVRGRNV